MSTAFATTDELSAYTGLSVDPIQGDLLLDLATSEIQRVAGMTISAVAGQTATLRGNWSRRLDLPERPVTNITSVVVDGGVPLVWPNDYTWQRSGTMWRPRGFSLATERTFDIGIFANWGGPDREVVVTYDHGVAAVPSWVKAICLEAAKRIVVNPSGLHSESIDGYAVSYDKLAPTKIALTPAEQDQLAGLRRRTATASLAR